jgi:predicted ester cyclase
LRRNIRLQKTAIIVVLAAVCCVVSTAQDQAPAPAPAAVARPNSSAGTPPQPATGASQNSQQAPVQAATSGETAEALARKYIELWNTGNAAGIASFPDFIMHNHGGRVRVGSSMLERVISAWRKSMPDLTFIVDDTIAQGDKVVMRVTLKGTYKERLFPEAGDPPSPPRLIRATGLLMFRTGDGKIQEIWQELDEGIMRTEMGAQWKTRQELAAEAAGTKSKKQEEAPASAPPPKP